MCNQTGQAGTLESNDILIVVEEKSEGYGIQIELNSIVEVQFGQSIRQTLSEGVAREGFTDVQITAVDKGALDCTIQARLSTALSRIKSFQVE
ncbi:citrate lyase acyl carrier protein [Salmonella enterica subsp. enterica serovar Winslow]|nr:citrate lyase acyl carrier protein [Salmonella enterica subsp. enterica serovar Saintpaul]ECL7345080.1 citrate lyase acyl carrier protein [Salmonella enterica subsp. enterica serovar Menston]MIX29359.1 citrate lyase acyl carrier protein [Salmonella enterica subsp. enterica serovar Livingstone]